MGLLAKHNRYLERWQHIAANIKDMVAEIADDHRTELADYNRKQLIEGKNTEGEWLPTYQSDPYFKTLGAADRYAAWKAHKSPSRNKPKDVMDFFIDGTTHKSIFAEVSNTQFSLFSTVPWSDSLKNKTNDKVLGLNPESRHRVWLEVIRPPLVHNIIKLHTK